MANAGLRVTEVGYSGRTMSPRNPAWLTVEDVADRLGLSLAEVYEEITAERLPAQRYGNSYLTRRVDVEEHLARRSVAAG